MRISYSPSRIINQASSSSSPTRHGQPPPLVTESVDDSRSRLDIRAISTATLNDHLDFRCIGQPFCIERLSFNKRTDKKSFLCA